MSNGDILVPRIAAAQQFDIIANDAIMKYGTARLSHPGIGSYSVTKAASSQHEPEERLP
jgi:hypothetical protein